MPHGTRRFSWRSLAFVCLVLLGGAWAARADEPVTWRLQNGIEATIYPPAYILQAMTVRHGDETLLLVDHVYYSLVTDIQDPIIVNRGDGSFHPMPTDAVLEALRAIRLDAARLAVRIYVLPYPRREVMDSSARDDVIMLSPGVRPVGAAIVHFTVTHEIGHIYQYRWLPDVDRSGWGRYAGLRGIQDTSVFHDTAVHKNRPHEVFAEDFRFCFGGSLATVSGTIENESLQLPTQVAGLESFLVGLPEARRAMAPRLVPTPNPFNPDTEIRVQFREDPGSRPLLLRIFDVQGRLVRRLWHGAAVAPELRIRWNGEQDGGQAATSGVYYARVDYAGTSTTAKLMLLE